MIRNLNTFCSWIAIFLLMLSSCSEISESNRGVWDQQAATFSIEEESISYTLPTDISSWAVAGQESMPSNMFFFGIDKDEGICIGIFSPDLKDNKSKKVADYSDVDIDVIARQLSNPDKTQTVHNEKIIKNKETFCDKEVWHYVVEYGLNDEASSDIITVYYSGYIFDGLKNPYGIVMISDKNPTDSIGQLLFKKYISPLHL